jgi:hypothetical protein
VIGVRLSDMFSPLRHPPFRRQFLAQAIETVGSALAPVADEAQAAGAAAT